MKMIKKIFFWDGNLKDINAQMEGQVFYSYEKNIWVGEADAGEGVSRCMNNLEKYRDCKEQCHIVTNFLGALNCDWINKDMFVNGYLIKDMFYLWDKKTEHWKPIEEFTDKELRYAHNLRNMYLAGAFNQEE